MPERDPKGRGCWYYTICYECPVCGRWREDRKRDGTDYWLVFEDTLCPALAHFDFGEPS